MAILKTKHQKKSFAITTVIYIIFFLLMFFFGLKYLDPPEERGIAVNFGTTDVGSGDVQPTEPVETSPQQNTPPPEQVEETSTEEVEEEVITQDTEDAPVIEDEEKEEETPEEVTEEPEEETQEEVEEVEEVEETEPEPEPEPDPKPDQSATDAMESMMNGPENDGEAEGGEGDDKGDPDGDPNAKNYYGTGKGLDGDGNYRLGGREALNKEKFVQECDESGEVVVKIEVGRDGNVIRATPGVKGTTNSSSCLTEPAKRAALATKFNKDADAPSRQIGFITYVFKLSE
ncbi:MAG: energy transducer TonB [Psychroflexus sp.]